MNEAYWKRSNDDVCPKCGRPTEILVEIENNEEYELAERCIFCKWEIYFSELT